MSESNPTPKGLKVVHSPRGLFPAEDRAMRNGNCVDPDGNVLGYCVQLTMPVDNPVDNVRRLRRKHGYLFEVPINTPDLHKLTYSDLLIMSEEASSGPTVHKA